MSGACLGKMIVFIYKWLKNAVFRREVSAADLASELVSEGVEEPTMGEAAALLVLSNVS